LAFRLVSVFMALLGNHAQRFRRKKLRH
jgi:hypothetical protein